MKHDFLNFVFVMTTLLVVVNCRILVETKSCPNTIVTGEFHSLEVTPCTATPCTFELHKLYTTKLIFTLKTDCSNITGVGIVKVFGIPVRRQELNFCKNLTSVDGEKVECPANGGQRLVLETEDKIPSDAPAGLTFTLEFSLRCQHEFILCRELTAKTK